MPRNRRTEDDSPVMPCYRVYMDAGDHAAIVKAGRAQGIATFSETMRRAGREYLDRFRRRTQDRARASRQGGAPDASSSE